MRVTISRGPWDRAPRSGPAWIRSPSAPPPSLLILCLKQTKTFKNIYISKAKQEKQNFKKTIYFFFSADWSLEALLYKWDMKCVHIPLESFGANKEDIAESALPGRHTVEMLVISFAKKDCLWIIPTYRLFWGNVNTDLQPIVPIRTQTILASWEWVQALDLKMVRSVGLKRLWWVTWTTLVGYKAMKTKINTPVRKRTWTVL